MFSDPVAATMVMQMLFFVGLVVVFFFLARSISAQGEETREALRKQQMYLADLERQLMDMSFLLRRRPGGEEGGPSGETAGPVRDELSPVGHRNDFLSMPSGRSGGRSGISDDLLLPPPILSSGARSESYDPEKDPFLFDDGFISASGRDAYGRNPAGSGLSGAEPRMPAARRREGGR